MLEDKEERNKDKEERRAFEARPHISRKEFNAIKCPVFVRVKYIDAPDSIELLMDKNYYESYVMDNGRLIEGDLGNYEQIVEVLGTVMWPELKA